MTDASRRDWTQKEAVCHEQEKAHDQRVAQQAFGFGVGQGLLAPHLITEDWCKENPLWIGAGKGLFRGQLSPSNREEVFGCLAVLLNELYRGGISEDAQSTKGDTYSSRIASFLMSKVFSEEGAPITSLTNDALQKTKGAWLLLLLFLLDSVLPDKYKKSSVPTKTKSFWGYRLLSPIAKSWEEWKSLPETFRIRWRPSKDSQHGKGCDPSDTVADDEVLFNPELDLAEL